MSYRQYDTAAYMWKNDPCFRWFNTSQGALYPGELIMILSAPENFPLPGMCIVISRLGVGVLRRTAFVIAEDVPCT